MVEEHLHSNYFHLTKLLHSKTNKLYFFHFLFNLAKAMVGIFIPVYLYQNGFSIKLILLINILNSIYFLFLIPFSTKLINKIGFKKSMLSSIPFYFFGLILLDNLNFSKFFLVFVIPLCFGIHNSLFWPVYHAEIVEGEKNRKRSNEVGNMQIILTIVASFGPYLGSLVLSFLNYQYLLFTFFFIAVIGTIPLLLAKDLKIFDIKISFKDYFNFFKSKKFRNSKIAFISQGIEGSSLSVVVWPLITFIFFKGNFLKYGFLYTFISLFSIIFMFFLKNYLSQYSDKQIYFLRKSSITLSGIWFLKLFLFSMGNFFLYFIMSFAKIAKNTVNITFMSIFYNNAKNIGIMKHIAFRELFIHSTKILFFSFIILIMFFFGENLQTLMFTIFFGVISSYFLSYLKEENSNLF